MVDEKRDGIDEALARRFLELQAEAGRPLTAEELERALAARAAGEPVPQPPPPDAPEPSEDQHELDWIVESRDDLCRAVHRVWLLAGEAQAEASLALLEQANRLGLWLVGVSQADPLAAIRLMRLFIRSYPRLPREDRRFNAFAMSWLDISRQPEAVDVLCDTARIGDSWLTFQVERAVLRDDDVQRWHPDLGGRLAELVDSGSLKAARQAAYWLTAGAWPEAVPALRRALRRPVLALRWLALHTLLEYPTQEVTEEEVLFLLEDAVPHPPPPTFGWSESQWREGFEYEATLLRAVRELRPAGGEEPLLRIVRGDCAYIRREREFLDSDWALVALAAGYPEVAVPLIDRDLKQGWSLVRGHAIKAAAELPPALAEPRLLEAAGDPDPDLAREAQNKWCEVTGRAWQPVLTHGLCTELLDGPLSERAETRLIMLRRKALEPRQQLASALFAEAPSREALVLLLFALGDTSLLRSAPSELGLPTRSEMPGELADRFGSAAVDGLIWLAERLPYGYDGWLGQLAAIVNNPVTTPEQRGRIQALAAGLVAASPESEDVPVTVFRATGTPPDLLEPLWQLAFERPDVSWPTRHRAFDLLPELCRDRPEMAERLGVVWDRALASGEWEQLEGAGWVALDAEVPGFGERVLRVMEEVDDPAAVGPVMRLASRLRDVGGLPEEWVSASLEGPASMQSVLGCRLLTVDDATEEPVRRAIEALTESTAVDGIAAVDATHLLLRSGQWKHDDPRVDAVLDRAAPGTRDCIYFWLSIDRSELPHLRYAAPPEPAPLERIRRHLAEELRSPDERVASEAFEHLYVSRPEGYEELLEEVYRDVTCADVRAGIEHVLDWPNEAELYWELVGDEDVDEGWG